MNNAMDYIDIKLTVEEKNLYLNQITSLNIDIENKSNYTIENGLFNLVLNDKSIEILDDNFKICLSDFIGLENIDPGFKISLKIPIKIKEIGSKLYENIFCYLNFHIVKDGELMDFTYKSDELTVNLVNKLNKNDFRVRFSKEKYFIDEDIHLLIDLENNTGRDLKNININNCIPNSSYVANKKVSNRLNDRVSILGENLNITQLISGEKINIDICLKIKEDIDIELIKLNPILTYIDLNELKFEVKKDIISTNINNSEIFTSEDFVYEIDKCKGFINDIISHKITIKNKIKPELLDLELSNNFSDKVEFVENSLIVGQIYRVGENISNIIKLGDLELNEEIVIMFKTKIISIENIKNMRCSLTYKTNRKTIKQESNSNKFEVFYPLFKDLNFLKFQSKNVLRVNDIVDITLKAINTGTGDAIDVLIKDELPSGLEFIESSLYLNFQNLDQNIITEGIKLDKVKPNEEILIKYKARAIDICTNEGVKANISYKANYKSNTLKAFSQEIITTVIGARIGNNNIEMNLNNNTAQIGECVTYTITLKNTGNIDCESLKLEVPLNDALEFVDDSIKVNDKEYEGLNIFDGIVLNKIKPEQIINISYQVKVKDFPRPNPVRDRAKLDYSYIFEDNIEKNTIHSTRTKLYINNPILEVVEKNSSQDQFDLDNFERMCFSGDKLYFNLILENKGNVGIEGLGLKLNSFEGLKIYKDSIYVNNKSYDRIENNTLKLPNLNVSQKLYIDFEAKQAKHIANNIEIPVLFEYRFKDLKTQDYYSKVKKINENIIIINPEIQINKFIADKDIEADREFTKNINIKNTGNILLKDVKLDLNENDFLKNCSKVTFVNGTYMDSEDEIYIKDLEVNETVNIAIRYHIDNIKEYESIIPESIINAKYSLSNEKELISITRKSNKLNLNVKNYSIDLTGTVNDELIMMNSINKYIFNVINDGNMSCENIKMKVNLPDDIFYIEKSLCINGKNIGYDEIPDQIDIGKLECNQLKNISFDFKVKNIPYKNQIKISAHADAYYIDEGDHIIRNFESKDNILNVENIDLDIVKVSSSEIVQKGDILQIQTIINNIGSIDVNDVFLVDNSNRNFIFEKDSVYIDGENIKGADPTKGIEIPCIKVGQNLLLTYDYKYVPTISSNKIIHYSDVSFCYKLKNREEERITTKSNTLYLEGMLSTFKEFSIENEYELKEYEPSIGDVVNVSTSAKIDSYYEITSIKNKSIENEESTGKKVIIKGIVIDRIEYLTASEDSALYMLERSQPFSVFINLPNDYDGEEIYFKPKSENVFYKSLGDRAIFTSSLITIDGSF